MIRIDVRLYGTLRRYRPAEAPGAPHHPFSLTLDEPETVAAVCLRLGIPDGLVAAAALNDEAVGLERVAEDGDTLALFPPSAGGS